MAIQLILDIDGVINPLALTANLTHDDYWFDFELVQIGQLQIYLSQSMLDDLKDIASDVIIVSDWCNHPTQLNRLRRFLPFKASAAPLDSVWKNGAVDYLHGDTIDRTVWIDDDESMDGKNSTKKNLLRITPHSLTGLVPDEIKQAREFLNQDTVTV